LNAVKQVTTQPPHDLSLSEMPYMIKIPVSTVGKAEQQNELAYDPNSLVPDQFASFQDFDMDSNMQLALPDW